MTTTTTTTTTVTATSTMEVRKVPLSPPSLEELSSILQAPLRDNYEQAEVNVVPCPDLRQSPFLLAAEGICGEERCADIGGQPNVFPLPQLDQRWSLVKIAQAMDMSPEKGALIGAGAGPFHVVGTNGELTPNLSWKGSFGAVDNQTRSVQVGPSHGTPGLSKCPSLDCALMANVYGSSGAPGPVLKVTARGRRGAEKSFTECIRKALAAAYGTDTDAPIVSLGGVFVIRSGRTRYHVMPDWPAEKELPFQTPKQLNDWLTYHDFKGPITCLSVMHSADPGKRLGLRMEHTHGFSPLGKDAGGHYHYDIDEGETVEYEGYFNTAKAIYRIDQPAVTLERYLHDE